MMKFIMPAVLIGISVAVFFTFTDSLYRDISLRRAQMASYNDALGNSKALENERDKLTSKYNAMSPDDLMKLQKLLPENIDNIRLILEIEKLASVYGMVLRDVKYNVNEKDTSAPAPGSIQGARAPTPSKNYGAWNLEFSTTGTYSNFINFTRDLENNLRVVDKSSIQFMVNPDTRFVSVLPEVYKYNFKIKTYWLKN